MDNNLIQEVQQNVWLQMFREYLVDLDTSYMKLSKKYNVPLRTVEAKGAAEQWPRQRAELLHTVKKRILKEAEDTLVEYKKKLIRVGTLASAKALRQLTEGNVEPESPRDVLQYLVSGLKLEGEGLGFDPHQQIQNNVINIDTQPRTPVHMTWANGQPLPPYRVIQTAEEEAEWLKEREAKRQSSQTVQDSL